MIVFSPGPSNLSEGVRSALSYPDISHRDEEFAELLRETRGMLLLASGVAAPDYRAVLLTGSGSSGIESVTAAAKACGPVLVVSNGAYGERAASMCRYHGTEVSELRLPWGAQVDPEEVTAAAASAGAGAVYLVHHETTTGRLNGLKALAAAARADRDRLVLVDAVSSIAGETLDIQGWGLDAVIGSSNKCIRGAPGVGFVIASDRFVEVALQQQAPHYTNLASHLSMEDGGATPFTPGLPAFFAFRTALAELLEEGVLNRIGHFRLLSERLMAGMSRLGFDTLLEPEAYGHTLLSYHLPSDTSYEALYAPLKERGFVIYGAQGSLAASAFRLGLVGHFGVEAVDGLLAALEEIRPA